MTEKNIVDKTVNELIDRITSAGRGFTLGLTTGEKGETSISVNEQLPPLDDRLHPANLRTPTLMDTASLIAFARRHGTPEKSIILCNTDHMALVMDYTLDRGEFEVATLHLNTHDDLDAWLSVLDEPMSHKDLVKFIRKYEHQTDNPEFVATIRTMSITGEVSHDSDLQDDGNSVSIRFKTKAGENLKKFPKEFIARVPVLEIDGEEQWKEMKCRLLTDMPTKPGEPVMFTILSSDMTNALRERAMAEAELVRDALNGNKPTADSEAATRPAEWLVVCGNNLTCPRTVGVKPRATVHDDRRGR